MSIPVSPSLSRRRRSLEARRRAWARSWRESLRPPLVPALVAVSALALVLAACGAAQENEPVAAVAGEPSSAETLDALIFGSWDDTDANADRAQQEASAFEDRVARCMAAAGFEYTPVEPNVATYDEPDLDYLSREYAETYGFGYTTRFNEDYSVSYEEGDADPNSEFVNSLSAAEQEQYYIALYGDQSFWDDIETDEERIALEQEQPELFQARGCQGESESQQARATQVVYTAYGDDIQELYELAEAHPAVQAPLADWRECMAEQGHNFQTPDDFDTVMDPYVTRLYESASNPAEDVSEEEMAAMTEDQLNELWSQPTEYDPDLLAEAQAYEIELAVTSWDCGLTELYDSYQDAFTEVRRQFITANLDEIQAMLDS